MSICQSTFMLTNLPIIYVFVEIDLAVDMKENPAYTPIEFKSRN